MARKSHAPRSSRDPNDPWRVRDRLTRHRYFFETRSEALAFVENVSTSEITGEPLRQWEDRLVVEKNTAARERDRRPAKTSRAHAARRPRRDSGKHTIALLQQYGPMGLSTRIAKVFASVQSARSYQNSQYENVNIRILEGNFKKGADVPVYTKSKPLNHGL